MSVEVDKDYVIVEGQKIVRPPHIARSSWLEMWECISESCANEEE